MNKKGMTLVEILAVIVILSLIIVIVATGGFGVFDNSKKKIYEETVNQVKESVNVLMVDVQNCDGSTHSDLLLTASSLVSEGTEVKSCNELVSSASGNIDSDDYCIQVTLGYLIDNNYISGSNVESMNRNMRFKACLDEDNPTEEEPIIKCMNCEETDESGKTTSETTTTSTTTSAAKEITQLKNYSKDTTEDFYDIKKQIVEIHFVKNINYDNAIEKWEIQTDDSVNKIYAWTENSTENDKYILYIGSNDEIFANKNSSYLFYYFENLTKITFDNFNTSLVEDMSDMFAYCKSLMTLDLSNFKTENVGNMRAMFYFCSLLETLNISSFETGKVRSMAYMFDFCKTLKSLDVSNFDTSNVTDMGYMFGYCQSLTTIDVSSFNTSKVTSMAGMFTYCSGLTTIDLTKFNTSKVTRMHVMFSGCSSLTKLDLSNFDTSNVDNMHAMFSGCSSLTILDVSKFNTSKVTSMSDMFSGCSSLTSLNLSNFNTSLVTDMSYMFYSCSSLTSLKISGFNTNLVTDMDFMFHDCTKLTNLDLSSFDFKGSMTGTFNKCTSLKTLYIKNSYYSAVSNSLSSSGLSGVNINKV